VARRAIVRGSARKRDFVWVTVPLPGVLISPTTQQENTLVAAVDWRAADGFERATVLRLILQGNWILEPGIGSTCAALFMLAVSVGNGSVTVPNIDLQTTWNDFDLVAPWTGMLAQNANGENAVAASQEINMDVSFRRRISVEDNVTLVTLNQPLSGVSGTDAYWDVTARVLLMRE